MSLEAPNPPVTDPPAVLGGGPPGGRLTRAPWGPGNVVVGFLVLAGLVIVAGAIATAVFGDRLDSLGGTAFLQALFAIVLAAAAILVAGSRREARSQPAPETGAPPAPGQSFPIPARNSMTLRETLVSLGFRRPGGRPVADAAIAYVTYFVFALIVAALLSPDQTDVTRTLGVGESALLSIIAGVLIIVAAPLSEEIFFRGFAFSGLRRGMPFVFAALIANGVWGVFHLTGGDFAVVIQLTGFGIALSWLFERTNSLWPAVGLHALNNAIAFAVLTNTSL